MKLRKDKGETVKLDYVCEKTQGIDYRKQTGIFKYIDITLINSNFKRISEIQEIDWSEVSSRAWQRSFHGNSFFMETLRL